MAEGDVVQPDGGCARKVNGTFVCFGKGAADIPPGRYSEISPGIDGACGLGSFGLRCWGTYYQVRVPKVDSLLMH